MSAALPAAPPQPEPDRGRALYDYGAMRCSPPRRTLASRTACTCRPTAGAPDRRRSSSWRGRIGRDVVKAAVLDDWRTPWSVCRPDRQNLGGVLTATVATIVMVPADGLIEVAMLPSEQTSFARHALVMEEPVRAAPAPRRAVA